MDARQFLEEFGHIASAPEGVQRLRELILQLAISGKLVEASPIDEPVANALSLAAQLKSSYEAKFKFHTTHPHPPVDSVPYPIPAHWQWVRLEQIALYIQRGKGPTYAEKSNTFVISQKCVQWSGFDLSPARFVAEDSLKAYGKERFLQDGDLLWNSTGTGTAGRITVYVQAKKIRAVADSHVTVIRLANFLPRYIWCIVASPWVQLRIVPGHVESLVSGTTQQVELATSTARALPIPCPPINEQVRIVAKVDELMALCDKLEAQQQERQRLCYHSRQVVFKAFTNTASSNDFWQNWKLLEDHSSILIDTSESITELRDLIRFLAVRGLLVPQDDHDEPARELMFRIHQEKEMQVGACKRKRIKPLPSIDKMEKPFDLPKGWVWARFPELGEFARGKSKHRPRNASFLFNPGVYPLVQTGEVARAKRVITEYHSKYSELGLSQSRLWPKGTLCITIAANIANAAILGFDACFPDSIVGFIPASEIINQTDYFLTFMETARDQLLTFAPSTAQKNINLEILESVLIPVPPLSEMRQIIDKLRGIMAVCDKLEIQLQAAQKVGQLLAATAVSAITGIRIDEEEERLKIPKTELISNLRLGKIPGNKEHAPLATILARQNDEMSAKDLWQRFGGDIDAFYAQLKLEVSKGWVLEPAIAEMREIEAG